MSTIYGEGIRDRVRSILAGTPFQFAESQEPWSFERQPTTQIDGVFRVEMASQTVRQEMDFRDIRIDTLTIWTARLQGGDPNAVYRTQLQDVNSITAAVIRDGATGGGDYAVPDGRGFSLRRDPGAAYAMARISIPVDYETSV